MERSLATVRKISNIADHTNSDNLELAYVDGWQCVVKRGEFVEQQLIVYFEIDSWMPSIISSFLSKGKEPKEFGGIKGERLRTVKLRGEISQGLILPLSVLGSDRVVAEGDDVSDLLDVQKWERPLSAQLAGQARGYFPEFIGKTDQPRIQNQFKRMQPEHFADSYEVTLKIDGSSCTFFHKDGVTGVCSRNLELKTDESNEHNAFVRMYRELDIEAKLQQLGHSIAIQGELFGEGINGNWEGIKGHKFMVFDIYDIVNQRYVDAATRGIYCTVLRLDHVPILNHDTTLEDFGSAQDFLAYASRPSIRNKVAEGVVFKSLTNPDYSFKAINNEYLLGGGE